MYFLGAYVKRENEGRGGEKGAVFMAFRFT